MPHLHFLRLVMSRIVSIAFSLQLTEIVWIFWNKFNFERKIEEFPIQCACTWNKRHDSGPSKRTKSEWNRRTADPYFAHNIFKREWRNEFWIYCAAVDVCVTLPKEMMEISRKHCGSDWRLRRMLTIPSLFIHRQMFTFWMLCEQLNMVEVTHSTMNWISHRLNDFPNSVNTSSEREIEFRLA